MKVIKRDGRAVDYDRAKIQIAIEKANKEVSEQKRATGEDIKGIITYIESLDKKRILVEDIQDIIEEKLMELKKYELAKKYIVYRYNRALVRKQNTTDETILGIIRNENRDVSSDELAVTAVMQRNLIAKEVSKDLTKRLLLPEKIVKAISDGIIYFHNADYFMHPMINSSLINLKDMLDNGTVINGTKIETPKSFLVACIVATQIIEVIATNQCGGLAIDTIHFGKYLRKSYYKLKDQIEKENEGKISEELMESLVESRIKSELKSGVQMIQYQINALEESCGKKPDITLFLHIEEDEYVKENAMIIEEILTQRLEGIKNEEGKYDTPNTPKLVYVLDECNALNGKEYDYLTKLAIKCSQKRKYPSYISAKQMKKNYENNVFSPIAGEFLLPWKDENGEYKFEGRFNQGMVSLNLPQIAILADGDENKFWQLLKERLDICFEALMCRHYSLVGIKSNISPLHWSYGAISRLEKNETIDSFLYGNYSTISLGYLGIYEMCKIMKNESQFKPRGYEFTIQVLKYLKETVEKWKTETNIGFVLCGTNSKNVAKKFALVDKEKFGIIKDITNKGYYMNSFFTNGEEEIDPIERLKLEAEFQKLTLGGAVSIVNLKKNDETKWEDTIKFIHENIQHAIITK